MESPPHFYKGEGWILDFTDISDVFLLRPKDQIFPLRVDQKLHLHLNCPFPPRRKYPNQPIPLFCHLIYLDLLTKLPDISKTQSLPCSLRSKRSRDEILARSPGYRRDRRFQRDGLYHRRPMQRVRLLYRILPKRCSRGLRALQLERIPPSGDKAA